MTSSRGRLRRLAESASGPEAGQQERKLAARRLPGPVATWPGAAVIAGRIQLIAPVNEPLLRAGAVDEADLQTLRSLQITAVLQAPLLARGRVLGVLSLIATRRSRRRYDRDQLEFVEALAGRVALALYNAGLFTELQSAEAQLSAALDSLGEAVTIQNPHGNSIYANQAAAEMAGSETPQQMLSESIDVIADRFELFC